MERLQFNVLINAPAHSVWTVLWGEDTYPKWTSVFSEDSKAVTDWQEGSKVHFLGGEGEGMFSRIERRIDNELMSIEHLGVLKHGVEQPPTAETGDWAGAREVYKRKEEAGQMPTRVISSSPKSIASCNFSRASTRWHMNQR